MRKIKLFTLLAAAMFATSTWANTTSGKCGDNLTWEVTGERHNYVLTISGTGAMYDFDRINDVPWQEYMVGTNTINLPDGITHLGAWAFHATGIAEFVVPNSVQSIGDGCFSLTASLKSITLPSNLKTLGYKVFDSSGLTSLTIPASVTSIGFGLTENCPHITSLSVEAGNTVYESPTGSNAIITKAAPVTLIAGCKNTVIPNNVTVIGVYALGLPSLTNITIPNGVTTLQDHSFSDCWSVESLFIPASVTSISSTAFSDNRFVTITVDPANPVYVSPENSNAIVERATNKLIVGCAYTKIPTSVTTIGEYAYFNSDLISVTIPANVEAIGNHAFSLCKQLKEIICERTTPPSLNVVSYSHSFGNPQEAFSSYNETPRTIPVYVPVGSLAAYQAAEGWNDFVLKEITERQELEAEPEPDHSSAPAPCADTDEYRGACGKHLRWVLSCENQNQEALKLVITGYGPMYEYAYYTNLPWYEKKDKITSISLPEGLTTISPQAFIFTKITQIDIPASVTTIGYDAFSNCSLLTTVNIPTNSQLKTMGYNLFGYDDKITSLFIPASVKSISFGLTSMCTGLTQIVVDANNTVFDSRNNCNAIIRKSDNALIAGCKTTVIPEGIKKIEEEAFFGAPFAANLEIPESVVSFDRWAMQFCTGQTSITLPAGVIALGAYALSMESLQSITCKAYVPPTADKTTFNHVDKSIPLYVYPSRIAAYKAADVWKEFTNYQPIPGEEPQYTPQPCEDTEAYRGTICEGLTWMLTCDYQLIITGTGAIPDYSYPNYAPWDAKKSEVKSISLPNGLTSIGDYAFYMMNNLNTEVVVPEGVTSIGYCAFFGAAKLPAITLPSTLITLGSDVFGDDYKLASLTIPANVSSIGTGLTSGCEAMESIVVDPANKTFDSRDNCNAIIHKSTMKLVAGCKNSVIPDGVSIIGEHAFDKISTLKAITIPNSVTKLEDYCFKSCSGLETLALPASVNTISSSAFDGCTFKSIVVDPNNTKFDSRDNCNAVIETSSKTLVLGCENSVLFDGLLVIGEGAFMGNKNLKSITMPASLVRIKENALKYCKNLESITCYATTPPTAEDMAFYYGSSSLNMPSTIPVYVPEGSINAYKAANQWSYFTNIQAIDGYTPPENTDPTPCTENSKGTCGETLRWVYTCEGGDGKLVILGTGAMYDYGSYTDPAPWKDYRDVIKSIELPEGLTSIGSNAFYSFNNLNTAVVVPEGVTSIGDYAFSNETRLPAITLPSTLKTLGKGVFSGNASLQSLTIPASVTSIGSQLTQSCAAVTTLVVEAGNTHYDSRDNCNAVIETATNTLVAGCKTTVIPNTVTTIGAYAFAQIAGFTKIEFPNSVTKLADNCYEYCAGVNTDLIINANITDISSTAFGSCDFKSIKVTSGNPKYDSRNDCNAIIETATNVLVKGCGNTVIPETVTAIADGAFKSCSSLKVLSIPANVQSIGNDAFAYCKNIETITCYATVPPTLSFNSYNNALNSFSIGTYYLSPDVPVYVSAASVAAYKAADGWKDFTNIQPIAGASPQPCDSTDAYSGTCGENLKWVLTCEGELVITGTGAIPDFNYPTYGPWHAKRAEVKSISLPNGLTSIGKYAFYMMDEMNTAVVIPEGVTSIGYCAFAGDRKMPAITLPSTLTTLGGSVFSTANKLESLTIPANVSSIGSMLTEECEALTSIVVDANNTTFDSRDNCNAIIKTSTNALVAGCKTTVIPNTVASIGTGAFSSIKGITAIKIPNSVTTLGDYCFQYCSNVQALVLPTSVVNISGTAFTGCVFQTIEVIPGNPKFDSRDNCNAIIETATNTLVKGSENSVLPNELKALGEGAFMSNKNLKFINIPAGVERMAKNALIYCKGLEAITCFATTPPVADNLAFNYGAASSISIPPTIPVYVPAASIDLYRNAANWNYFTNFVPLSSSETTYYTVKALANHGKVNGTGTYASGTEITLTPVADEGYVFKQWSDGTTATPKSLTLTRDTTIRAMFEKVGETAAAPEVDKLKPNVIIFKIQAILKAFLYNVVIMKDGERVVNVVLDADGNIKLITKPVSAPSLMKVRKVVMDDGSLFGVELTELEVGQQYTYMVDAYDAQETCISAKAGSFSVSRGIIMGDQSTAEEITNILTANNGQNVADLSITRTIQRNDYFSTLCVPFGMNATQIANSSLATAEIREFTKAQVVDNQLYVVCSPVSEIVAGKPYVIRYMDASALNRLDFSNVTVNAAAPAEVTFNHVTMKGTYIPFEATSGNCFVFVNEDNMPYWPSTPSTLKPFRCYFVVDANGNNAPVCGMTVNIVESENAPTALDAVHNDVPFVKTIENGMLIIEKNGVRYNAQGQIVK